MKNKKRNISIVCCLFFLVLGFSLPIADAADDAAVHVTAIVASQSSDFVDPELTAIADEIKSTFTFSSYRRLKRYTVVLAEAQSDRIILDQDNPLVVTYQGVDADGKIMIRLEMNDILNAECSLMDGGHLLVGGPEYEDGNLILLIEATK